MIILNLSIEGDCDLSTSNKKLTLFSYAIAYFLYYFYYLFREIYIDWSVTFSLLW